LSKRKDVYTYRPRPKYAKLSKSVGRQEVTDTIKTTNMEQSTT